jgi:ATPase subunit of ABC transporter with duplicated ATPase domains
MAEIYFNDEYEKVNDMLYYKEKRLKLIDEISSQLRTINDFSEEIIDVLNDLPDNEDTNKINELSAGIRLRTEMAIQRIKEDIDGGFI